MGHIYCLQTDTIVKLKATGEEIWAFPQTSLPYYDLINDSDTSFKSLLELDDGSVLITVGPKYENTNERRHCTKISSNGNVVWDYDFSNYDYDGYDSSPYQRDINIHWYNLNEIALVVQHSYSHDLRTIVISDTGAFIKEGVLPASETNADVVPNLANEFYVRSDTSIRKFNSNFEEIASYIPNRDYIFFMIAMGLDANSEPRIVANVAGANVENARRIVHLDSNLTHIAEDDLPYDIGHLRAPKLANDGQTMLIPGYAYSPDRIGFYRVACDNHAIISIFVHEVSEPLASLNDVGNDQILLSTRYSGFRIKDDTLIVRNVHEDTDSAVAFDGSFMVTVSASGFLLIDLVYKTTQNQIGGSVTGYGYYEDQEQIVLQANPIDGYALAHFYNETTAHTTTDNPYSSTMGDPTMQALEINAEFEPDIDSTYPNIYFLSFPFPSQPLENSSLSSFGSSFLRQYDGPLYPGFNKEFADESEAINYLVENRAHPGQIARIDTHPNVLFVCSNSCTAWINHITKDFIGPKGNEALLAITSHNTFYGFYKEGEHSYAFHQETPVIPGPTDDWYGYGKGVIHRNGEIYYCVNYHIYVLNRHFGIAEYHPVKAPKKTPSFINIGYNIDAAGNHYFHAYDEDTEKRYMVKYDTTFNLVWEVELAHEGYTEGDLHFDDDENIILLVNHENNAKFIRVSKDNGSVIATMDSGQDLARYVVDPNDGVMYAYNYNWSPSEDVLLRKYDKQGNMLWESPSQIAEARASDIAGIILDEHGNVLHDIDSRENNNHYIIVTAPDGTQTSNFLVQDTHRYLRRDCLVAKDGYIYSSSLWGQVVRKFDYNGNKIWSHMIDTDSYAENWYELTHLIIAGDD